MLAWWDNTIDTRSVPVVQKQLNVGGTLPYSVVQSDILGRSITYNGSLVVNFPPAIVGLPSISVNDAAFPYDTLLQSTSYDPEHPGGTELTFEWYDGPAFISNGITTIVSTGTYLNGLEVDGLDTDETLTQIITDTSNGVTQINYFLRGFTPSGLQGSSSSISNSIISSANNVSNIIIGPGQEATFTAYAQDTSNGQLQFLWSAGTLNGWTQNFQTTDTPAPLSNGLYKSQITLSVGTETSGVKTVLCEVTNLETLQSIIFDSAVSLVAAQAPTITAISTDAPIINGGYAVSQSGFVHFSAVGADPNNALLSYEWVFTQPAVTLYGRTVMLRPSDYAVFDETILVGNGTNPGTGPLPIIGQVTVTDRFDQTSTVSLNQFVTTLVWPYTQVAPATSGTGSTALQKRYWGVSDKTSLETDDLLSLNSDFSNQRNLIQTFNPSSQYIYVIYPAAFGTATINLNTSVVTDWLLTVVTFNAVSYNVYRSGSLLSGLNTVIIS